LPGAVFSTSASALCVPPLRWGLLARLARRAVSEVLVRSSNWDLSGHCVSSVGRNVPRNLTRPACGFSSPPAARFQVRIYRRGATRAVGTGESCPEVPLARVAASGSRAHQLHPTFLRLPGVISELLARAVLIAEPAAEADRGRHFGFPRFNVFPGGPGSLAWALPPLRA
jgi:hypothetical protein